MTYNIAHISLQESLKYKKQLSKLHLRFGLMWPTYINAIACDDKDVSIFIVKQRENIVGWMKARIFDNNNPQYYNNIYPVLNGKIYQNNLVKYNERKKIIDYMIYVNSSYRGKGIGSALIKAGIEYADKMGAIPHFYEKASCMVS